MTLSKQNPLKLPLFVGVIILLFFSSLLQQSCKKTDNVFKDPGQADRTARFFNLPANASNSVQRVAAALQKQNSAKEFINAFTKNEGFPVWDKSCINLVTPNSATATTGIFIPTGAIGDATPDTIVITPLVLDKATYVNGFILSKVRDTVSMTLYRNSDYQYLPFQTATPATYTTAEDFAIHMMAMDHNVFGYTSFAIKDKRLFNNSSNYKDTANVKRTIDFGNNNGGPTINYAQIICVTITTTTTSNHCPYPPNQCPDIHTGVLGLCDNCPEYCASTSTYSSTQCLSTGGGTGWPSFPPPPPPTGGGGSGGGGTGGGGTGLPPCPGGGIPMTNNAIPVNCSPVPNPWPSIISGISAAEQTAFITNNDPDKIWWNDPEPNVTYPPQQMPTWDSLYKYFPKLADSTEMCANQLYNLIGGDILNLYNSNPAIYNNGCALRLSRALNYSGVSIPNIPGQTYKGSDNKYYFLGAAKLYNWMKKTFTDPPNTQINLTNADGGVDGVNFPGLLAGKKGIYIMQPSYPGINYFGASGHCSLWNGNSCIHNKCQSGIDHDGTYFNAKGGVQKICLWELN